MSHRSRICALLIDCPQSTFEPAVSFWSAALGRPVVPKTNPSSRYTGLATPKGPNLDVFLQAIEASESRLHFDIETDDVEAEVGRLEQLGARRLSQVEQRWVLEAPSGHVFYVVPIQSQSWPEGTVEWSR